MGVVLYFCINILLNKLWNYAVFSYLGSYSCSWNKTTIISALISSYTCLPYQAYHAIYCIFCQWLTSITDNKAVMIWFSFLSHQCGHRPIRKAVLVAASILGVKKKKQFPEKILIRSSSVSPVLFSTNPKPQTTTI